MHGRFSEGLSHQVPANTYFLLRQGRTSGLLPPSQLWPVVAASLCSNAGVVSTGLVALFTVQSYWVPADQSHIHSLCHRPFGKALGTGTMEVKKKSKPPALVKMAIPAGELGGK